MFAGHALVVGGTGMLAPVTIQLAERGRTVTVIGRRKSRLAKLQRAAGEVSHQLNGVALDYRDGAALESALGAAVAEHGPVDLVVAWVHSVAPDAPLAIARALGGVAEESLRYIHVLGSAAADPSAPDAQRREAFEALPGVTYEEVILGFVMDWRSSRWLTNDEISAGVLRVIDDPTPRSIVGVVRPWEARP